MIRRRQALGFLASAPLLPTASLALTSAGCTAPYDPRFRLPPPLRTGPFQHGVASGDPTSTSVIIWTRVSDSEAEVEVRYEVALDASFAQLVNTGTQQTSGATDFTVHVDITGLAPGTRYFYRFFVGETVSPVGRSKTLPGVAESTTFAVFSCANFANGYFHAYRNVAVRDDIDFALHLGDYIYEHGSYEYGTFSDYDPPHETVSLSDYRRRYRQYHLDADLQLLRARHPLIATWDDHEIANNAYSGGAQNHDITEGPFGPRFSAAKQAYLEWLPIRTRDGGLSRSFTIGDLAELTVLDTRGDGRSKQPVQFQDPQPANCGCPDINDLSRQLMSESQWDFVEGRFRNSGARWHLVAQQVVFSSVPGLDYMIDGWEVYPRERERLKALIANHAPRRTVILTGDVHSSWALEIPDATDQPLAVELITPAVSSPQLYPNPVEPRQADFDALPNVAYVNLRKQGYLELTLTRNEARAMWHHLDNVQSLSPAETSTQTARVMIDTAQIQMNPERL